MIVLVLCCLVTWVIYLDSHSIGMKHKNLWVLGTFLLLPLAVPLYLIRRAQFLHQHQLTPRQKLEARAREASRKRREKAEREKAEREKQQWEQEQRQKAQADPEKTAREKAERYREKHEMRLRLDEQLSSQQQRHARKWGIHRE